VKALSKARHHPKRSFVQRLFQELLLKSWWVFAFILLNFCIFDKTFKHLDQGEAKLHTFLAQLQQVKEEFLKRQGQMELEIESQKDPRWIELLLKKELGLVSEGQMKVQFLTQ
jgi:hypothetical protein